MHCQDLDALIEAFADGSLEPTAEQRAHLAGCAACGAGLEQARAIETWLATRDAAPPPPTFTASVMARLGEESWRAERAFDLGFNLAVAAGLLVVLMGAAGVAWSFGVFTITLDVAGLLAALTPERNERAFSDLQTVVLAVVLLTAALGLWSWAEGAAD